MSCLEEQSVARRRFFKNRISARKLDSEIQSVIDYQNYLGFLGVFLFATKCSMTNFTSALRLTLTHEGGFVNNPRDPGGATNLGVTKRIWERYVNKEVDVEDIKNLTYEDVEPLYSKFFWKSIHGDELPIGVSFCVFDMSVN